MILPCREIRPISHALNATVCVPGSKSLTNRALLTAALASGETRIMNALFSDDSLYFARALQSLGFKVRLDEAKGEIAVAGIGGTIRAHEAELFIGNAGTAARFLTAFLTLGHGEYMLDGNARMRERPIGDLASALSQLGANIETASGCPPARIIASGLPGGRAALAGNVSSQFLSALLMVAPYARQPVELKVSTELNSKPYIDMTLAVMDDFGVEVQRDGYQRFLVQAACYQRKESYVIEPDATAASYFFAAAAICGGVVRVENISSKSKQGDVAFPALLAKMGCGVSEGGNTIEVTGATPLRGIDADMSDFPDTAQTLAAIAPFASTPTRIRGVASARLKETDRVHAACTELARLGVRVEEHADGMTIYPCKTVRAASIQTYNDHRMAMAFSLIGLRVPGVIIENPGCVSKTFPGYFQALESLQ